MDSLVYTSFVVGEDIIDASNTIQTENVWSDGVTGTMSVFYTSSVQVSSSGDYYYDIYQSEIAASGSAIQFSIAYGDQQGSGSYEKFTDMGTIGYTPSKAIYYQYRNLLLPRTSTQFSLYTGKAITQFMAIAFDRSRLKDQLDPGNWELTLGTGITLIDSNTGTDETAVSDSYDVVSGSQENGFYDAGSGLKLYYGKVYPKYGVIILDGDMLAASASISIDTATHDTAATNNNNTFLVALNDGASFQARNKQLLSNKYYFVRVKNSKYNYSNNPTYTSGSNGVLKFNEFITDPVTYITTVGLFNDGGELLAVSKLSQPIKKTKNDEALIKVMLSF